MRSASIGFLIFLFAQAAHSVPVVWEFSGDAGYTTDTSFDSFVDGFSGVFAGPVTGSFIFDADAAPAARVTDVNVSAFGMTFTQGRDCGTGGDTLDVLVTSGVCLYDAAESNIRLQIATAAPLTNAGGAVTLVYGGWQDISPIIWEAEQAWSAVVSCSDIENWCYSREVRSFVGGTLVGTAVPVPAALWLFASALAALGWARRFPA